MERRALSPPNVSLCRRAEARRSTGAVLLFLFVVPLNAALQRFDAGNPADVTPALQGPIIHMAGGGGDVDAAFQATIDRIRGCSDCEAKIDVVVLRASGRDGYNDYLLAMPGVDSVTTFVVTDRMSASGAAVLEAVRNAEYVFFAGGDQCNYVKLFNDGPVERELRALYARGGAIGGTSAGMAIQGKAAYDACNDASAQSKLALADPYNHEISFTTDFFDWPALDRVITDTHFAQRDRMGRLFAFIARQLRELPVDRFLGIAANERTALLVDDRGMAHVFGDGPAYFVLGDHFPERALPGQPLTYCGYKIWRVPTGLSYDLRHQPAAGFYTVDVNEGVILRDPY